MVVSKKNTTMKIKNTWLFAILLIATAFTFDNEKTQAVSIRTGSSDWELYIFAEVRIDCGENRKQYNFVSSITHIKCSGCFGPGLVHKKEFYEKLMSSDPIYRDCIDNMSKTLEERIDKIAIHSNHDRVKMEEWLKYVLKENEAKLIEMDFSQNCTKCR